MRHAAVIQDAPIKTIYCILYLHLYIDYVLLLAKWYCKNKISKIKWIVSFYCSPLPVVVAIYCALDLFLTFCIFSPPGPQRDLRGEC